MPVYLRKPDWLKQGFINTETSNKIRKLINDLSLHTVCESARCPNRPECYRHLVTTFMILGDTCTRKCTFCAVDKGNPLSPDPLEPNRIVQAIKALGLKHVVITSVTRDDLPDGGASQFARTVLAIREYNLNIPVEVLVPDFRGSYEALKIVIDSSPKIISHNIETVRRLYTEVRPQASYTRSLDLLLKAKLYEPNILTKSGIMLGLGESRAEVLSTMFDLKAVGCDILTIGQYLVPSVNHHEVVKYISPREFAEYADLGRQLGFAEVFSGPLVRSSLNASEIYEQSTEF